MYISRVEINTFDRKNARELTHIGAFHNWVEQSFPEEFEKSERSRKLWRIDDLSGKKYLLLVSSTKPDLAALSKYGVEGTAATKSYDSFLDSLQAGDRMRFRVVLNPVVALSQGIGKRGLIKPYRSLEEQNKYLLERAGKNGFILKNDDFAIVEKGCVEFKKTGQKPLKLVKVVYEGNLTISDVDIFRKTLIEGFGKKKAYGFGMMTVIPVLD